MPVAELEIQAELAAIIQVARRALKAHPDVPEAAPLHEAIEAILDHARHHPHPGNEVLHDLDVAMEMAQGLADTDLWQQLLDCRAKLRYALIPSLNPEAEG